MHPTEPQPEAGLSLADELKASTAEQHVRTERHPFEVRMVSGQITAEDYARYLGQMYHVHAALDAGLALWQARAPLAGLILEHHFHAGQALADLACLGRRTAEAPLPATVRFVEAIRGWASAGEGSILGVWYVLEGSTNGGQYIARALERVPGVAGAVSSISPHGPLTRERWAAWRSGVNALALTPGERSAAVRAAGATFDHMYDLLEEVSRGTPGQTPVKIEAAVFVAGKSPQAGAV